MDAASGSSPLEASQSILGTRSLASPDFLDPESPGSPVVILEDSPHHDFQSESETYTPINVEPAAAPHTESIAQTHAENNHNDDEVSDAQNIPNINNEASNEIPVYEVASSPEIHQPEVSNEPFRFTAENRNTSNPQTPLRTDDEEDEDNGVVDAAAAAVAGSSIINTRNSDFDFTETRRMDQHEDGPPTKVRKLSDHDDTDGETCPICYEPWSNSGEHRLVALKCGHLFGAACVLRWLKGQPAKDRCCPSCKTKATSRDIRYIYARRLVATDTSQITTLQRQIETLQAEKSRVELELQKSQIANRACILQLEVLRSTLMKSQPPREPVVRKTWRFALEKNLEICKDGGCRVLTYNCRTYELYVSQKSSNYLFPGYGIRKVSCVDYRLGQYVPLHPKAIRDITYSQPKDLLLSVGLDSSARIVERGILNVTIQAEIPLWSCSWDYMRGNEFYVGGVGGVIHQYDVRNPRTYIQRLQVASDLSPVVSLCSTEFGLLSCQLNTCWLWVQNSSRQWEPKVLPLDGPFMSLCYDNDSHRALVSCRPGPNGERSKLALCKLKTSVPSGEVVVDTETTFMGSMRSSVMSRAAFVKAPSCSWIASHSESDSALFLHGLDGVGMSRLPSAQPALDVTSVQLNGDTLVASLSESRLRLYKAVSSSY